MAETLPPLAPPAQALGVELQGLEPNFGQLGILALQKGEKKPRLIEICGESGEQTIFQHDKKIYFN